MGNGPFRSFLPALLAILNDWMSVCSCPFTTNVCISPCHSSWCSVVLRREGPLLWAFILFSSLFLRLCFFICSHLSCQLVYNTCFTTAWLYPQCYYCILYYELNEAIQSERKLSFLLEQVLSHVGLNPTFKRNSLQHRLISFHEIIWQIREGRKNCNK